MRHIMIRRKTESSIGYIIDTGDDDIDIAWCERCERRGTKTRLGEKILMNNGPPPPDQDQFLQCPKCYLLVPIYNVKFEGETYATLEVNENPFDFSKTEILGNDDTLRGRIKRVNRRRSMSKIKDAEVQKELDAGNVVTNYSTDMY